MSIIHDALKKAGSAGPGPDRPPLSVSQPKHRALRRVHFPLNASPVVAGVSIGGLLLIVLFGLHRIYVPSAWFKIRPFRGDSIPASKVSSETARPQDVPEIRPSEASIRQDRVSRLREEALSAYSNGDLFSAQAKFSELLTLIPDDAVLHNNNGLVLRRLGRLAEAEVAYQRAMALRPSYAEAMNNLALVLQEDGRKDEAGVWFAKAVSTDPSYAIGHLNYGLFLEQLGSLRDARSHYTKFIALATPKQAELVAKVRVRLERLGAVER